MAQATAALQRRRRRVRVAKVRFETNAEIGARFKAWADRHPAALQQRFFESLNGDER